MPGQTAGGGQDAFLRKYDAAGNELWTRQFGTATVDAANGVAVDASGVYVSGYTEGILAGARPRAQPFVRKYDLNGAAVWTRQFSTLHNNEPPEDRGASRFGERIAASRRRGHPGRNGAIRASVQHRRHRALDPPVRHHTSANGVAADATGVYVAGGTGTAPCRVRPTSDASDAFVRKYDAAGNELWTRQFGTAAGDGASGWPSDASGV